MPSTRYYWAFAISAAATAAFLVGRNVKNSDETLDGLRTRRTVYQKSHDWNRKYTK